MLNLCPFSCSFISIYDLPLKYNKIQLLLLFRQTLMICRDNSSNFFALPLFETGECLKGDKLIEFYERIKNGLR